LGFCGEVIIFLVSHTDRSSLQPFKSMDSENKTEKMYAPEIDNIIQRCRHIIDFMNLGHNKANEIIEKSFWYPT
jgi:hypothetical protein